MKNIVLLHAALGMSEDLELLAKALAKQGYQIHQMNFSGHGGTEFSDSFGIQRFSLELENFILANNIKNSIVFGYSLGGYVALYTAFRTHGIISKIITLGTKFDWSAETLTKELRMLNPELMLEKVPAFAETLLKKHGLRWKELVIKTAQMMQEINDKDFLNSDALKKIDTPVMLGLADRDQMVNITETLAVFKTLQKSSMCMLPDSIHQIESIDADVLSQMIRNFSKD